MNDNGDKIYDVGIIGSGIAGSFAALRLAQKHNVKSILFELGAKPQKRRRQCEGFLGCFPTTDGKIYKNDIDSVLNISDGRRVKAINNWVFETFEEAGPMKLVKTASPSAQTQKKIKEHNFVIKTHNYYQWNPNSIHQLSRNISNQIENNIDLSFDNEVYSLSKKKNVFIVHSNDGDYQCKKIIFAAGRSGWRWSTKVFSQLGILENNDVSRFGIRIELPAQYMKEFNKSHCSLKRDDLELGPFSWGGTVIPEDHADLVISAFRSNEDRWKTDKVCFSLLKSVNFADEACYQTDRLAKLTFLLFNDRVSKEKIRFFMKGESQLSLLPEYNWLKESLNEIGDIMPYILTKGSFHVPNIDPMAGKVKLGSNLESEIDGLFIVGESAGIKGIAAAAIMGGVAADSICK